MTSYLPEIQPTDLLAAKFSPTEAGMHWANGLYSIKRHGTTLTTCYSEPVQTPGCIQAHGVLIAVRLVDMVILQISENAQEFLGVAAEALLQASDHAMAMKAAEVSQGPKVLHVEDNPANLELVAQLLAQRPQHRLLAASHGALGLEFARAHLPAVILMDLNLPDISGSDILKILRADPATAHIPVTALSANAMPHEIQSGMQAGFFRYVTKPIRVQEFFDTLDEALLFSQKLLLARQ